MRPPWRSISRWAGAAAVLLGATLVPPPAQAVAAGTYYVSVSGDDAAAGGPSTPWRSLQRATAAAPAGAVVVVAAGTYAPFVITKPGQTVTAAPGASVTVRGRAGVRDVVRIAAPAATVRGLTVSGCVPDPTPVGGFNHGGSSAVRIDDGATGATVAGLTVRDSSGTNGHGLRFGCYGVLAHGADAARIVDNDIAGTGTGVYVQGGGTGTLIAGNRIHDNRVLIRNTPGGDDDFGANGITFSDVVAALPGPVATRNVITGNAGPSADYGYDGGAFEIYNSSHLSIVGNTVANNENVLETGTSPDGGSLLGDCVGNVFAGNDVVGRTAGSGLQRSVGLILRCATAMTITGNSFSGLDWWVYELTTGDPFSSDVRGLAITGNTVTADQLVYRLALDPTAAGLVIDTNRIEHTGAVFARYADGSASPDLAGWRARTGRDLLSTG